jgi:hypothetical protein
MPIPLEGSISIIWHGPDPVAMVRNLEEGRAESEQREEGFQASKDEDGRGLQFVRIVDPVRAPITPSTPMYVSGEVNGKELASEQRG